MDLFFFGDFCLDCTMANHHQTTIWKNMELELFPSASNKRIQVSGKHFWGRNQSWCKCHGHVFVEILPVGFRPLVGDPPKRNVLCNWGDLVGTETPILRHTLRLEDWFLGHSNSIFPVEKNYMKRLSHERNATFWWVVTPMTEVTPVLKETSLCDEFVCQIFYQGLFLYSIYVLTVDIQ